MLIELVTYIHPIPSVALTYHGGYHQIMPSSYIPSSAQSYQVMLQLAGSTSGANPNARINR